MLGRLPKVLDLQFPLCLGASIKQAYSEEMLSDIERVGKALVGGMTDVHGTKHKYTSHTASTPGLGECSFCLFELLVY